MKKILYLALTVVTLTACKKSKKEEITINTLIGTWGQKQPAHLSTHPAVYTFRKDSTYTLMAGDFVGTIHGTYRANPLGNDVRVLDVTLTPMQSPTTSFRCMIEFKSHNQMNMGSGGTIDKIFVRTK